MVAAAYSYTPTMVLMHSRRVITLLAIYKIPKLRYVLYSCALRNTPVDLAKVHYLDSFSIYFSAFTLITISVNQNKSRKYKKLYFVMSMIFLSIILFSIQSLNKRILNLNIVLTIMNRIFKWYALR